MFIFGEEQLERLCKQNAFEIPDDGLIFFGLRGCMPINTDYTSFSDSQKLQVNSVNYLNPRCTIGQWIRGRGLAVFLGSTVPWQYNVQNGRNRDGEEVNQLMTGIFRDYKKDFHKAGKPTGHPAFRQENKLPLRRTVDDLDFDNYDRVEYEAAFDNIHCGWSMGPNDKYSSAGCQVVIGYPKCERRGNSPDTGHWKIFKENAYRLSQDRFTYILLEGRDAQNASLTGSEELNSRLRYGSKGSLVSDLQQLLKNENFYPSEIDGEFGFQTLTALLNFQKATFGISGADGVVGPNTSEALGLSLPTV